MTPRELSTLSTVYAALQEYMATKLRELSQATNGKHDLHDIESAISGVVQAQTALRRLAGRAYLTANTAEQGRDRLIAALEQSLAERNIAYHTQMAKEQT